MKVKRCSGGIDVTRRKGDVSGFRESTGKLQAGSIVEEPRCVEYGGYPRHDRWQMKMEAGYETFGMEGNGGRTDSGGISECRGESPE